MFLWRYRQVALFFVLFIFYAALLIHRDWARALGPWPGRALLGLIALNLWYIFRN
jgi:hypothetical protein